METVVYIIRHSEGLMKFIDEYNSFDSFEIKNEKNPLSVSGEEKAKKLSQCDELINIDMIYSSHYVRTIATAKYIGERNNLKLNIDYRFGERRFGINDFKELPRDYFTRQIEDRSYKINGGECFNEVRDRMLEALIDVLGNNLGKRLTIVSHGTSLSMMLSKWCDLKVNNQTQLIEIYFNNELVFDGDWQAPELFKLVFDEENNLKSIKNIKY